MRRLREEDPEHTMVIVQNSAHQITRVGRTDGDAFLNRGYMILGVRGVKDRGCARVSCCTVLKQSDLDDLAVIERRHVVAIVRKMVERHCGTQVCHSIIDEQIAEILAELRKKETP